MTSNPARVPLFTFCIILFGAGSVLAGSPAPVAALLFFIGLYPGSARSGDPGYDVTEHYHLFYYWGAFMFCVYAVLLFSAWRRRSPFPAWIAVALLLLNGLGGCARLLSGIPGDL